MGRTLYFQASRFPVSTFHFHFQIFIFPFSSFQVSIFPVSTFHFHFQIFIFPFSSFQVSIFPLSMSTFHLFISMFKFPGFHIFSFHFPFLFSNVYIFQFQFSSFQVSIFPVSTFHFHFQISSFPRFYISSFNCLLPCSSLHVWSLTEVFFSNCLNFKCFPSLIVLFRNHVCFPRYSFKPAACMQNRKHISEQHGNEQKHSIHTNNLQEHVMENQKNTNTKTPPHHHKSTTPPKVTAPHHHKNTTTKTKNMH